MPRKQHAHKYCLRPTGGTSVWACALPDCSHYMPNYLVSLIEGKSSICWECEEKFIMDSSAMKEDKPRCILCRNPGVKSLLKPDTDRLIPFSSSEKSESSESETEEMSETMKNFIKSLELD